MNKWIILTASALLLLFSCKKNELIENQNGGKNLTILLNIPNDLILDRQSVDILIHDKDGALIDRHNDIENRTNYEFVHQNEASPVLFSLIYKPKIANNYNGYRIRTFLIEESIELTLGNYKGRNIEETSYNLLYDSDEEDDFVSSSAAYSGNGSLIAFSPYFFPTNQLISFNDKKTGLRKVVNIIDPQPNQTFVLDNLEKMDVKDSTTYEVNESGTVYSYLYGKRKGIDEHFINISQDNRDSNSLKKHYLPVNSINEFLLYTEIFDQDEYYESFDLKSSFELDYTKPEIDLDINEINVNRISLTSSNGDFFKTSLYNGSESGFPNTGYAVTWDIYGKIDQMAEFKIPNIEDYMIEMESEYVHENFSNKFTSVYKTQEEWDYDQFISFIIEGFALLNIPSSIERYSISH